MKKSGDSHKGVLLFDLDGTLIDTSGDIVRSVNYIRRTLGMSLLSVEEIIGCIGQGNFYLLSHATGIDEKDPKFAEIVDKFKEFYLAHQTERSQPYPGMRQVLEHLSGDYELFVLSNKPHVAVLAELAGHRFEGFFREIWGAGALPQMKPDPVGILKAAKLSMLPLSRTVMIGDMLPDVEAAKNAGSKSCFVSWGFGEISEQYPKPSVVVDRVPDLVAALDNLVSERQRAG